MTPAVETIGVREPSQQSLVRQRSLHAATAPGAAGGRELCVPRTFAMSHTTSEGAELSQLTLLDQAECRQLSRGAALSWAELRTLGAAEELLWMPRKRSRP